MINKLLKLFGLMTVKRAKKINAEIICSYARQVSQWAKEDFNAKPPIDLDKKVTVYANQCFDFSCNIPFDEFHLINEFEAKK